MNFIGSHGLVNIQVPKVVLKLIFYDGPKDFIVLIPKISVLDSGGMATEHHQIIDLGLQEQKLSLFQRTCRWDLRGGVSEWERIPAKHVGLQGQHSPSARTVRPHENMEKERNYQPSLMVKSGILQEHLNVLGPATAAAQGAEGGS